MTQPFNILISSAGRRGALVNLCRQTLADLGLVGRVLAADITRASAAYQLADAGFYAPRFDDPQFIPLMLDVCRQQGVKLLIPTHDRELMLYARTRERFEAIGTRVCICAPELIEIASDKTLTHAWLSGQGFPTPRQATLAEVKADPGGWDFPLIVKPRRGSASIGLQRLRDAEALARLEPDHDAIVQSLAPGDEFTVDVFVDRAGQCRCTVPRQRLEVRAGEVSKGLTVRDAMIESLAVRVAEALPGVAGVLNIQIFADRAAGRAQVIEINPRFGGGYPLTHAAGANLIAALLAEAGPALPAPDLAGWVPGRVMLRYDEAVFVSRESAGLPAE